MRKPPRVTDAAKPPANLMQIALERSSRSACGRQYAHTPRATGRYAALHQGLHAPCPVAPSTERAKARQPQSADDGGPTKGMAGALNRPSTPSLSQDDAVIAAGRFQTA